MGARLIKAAKKNKKKRMDNRNLILVFLFISFLSFYLMIDEWQGYFNPNNALPTEDTELLLSRSQRVIASEKNPLSFPMSLFFIYCISTSETSP